MKGLWSVNLRKVQLVMRGYGGWWGVNAGKG